MRNKMIDFTVEGVGDFPLDMLRYDECFPTDDESVRNIGLTYAKALEIENDRPSRRRVNLRKACERYGVITADRWASFGWKIVPHWGTVGDARPHSSHDR